MKVSFFIFFSRKSQVYGAAFVHSWLYIWCLVYMAMAIYYAYCSKHYNHTTYVHTTQQFMYIKNITWCIASWCASG